MTDAANQPVIPVRAKAGYIEVKRRDKGGRIRTAKQHMVASEGMHTAKEMEHVMREVAKEVGADESQIRIDTYKQGQAPIEANPRHRGFATRYERKTGVVNPPKYEKHLFTGAPQSPEEWEAHVAAFYEEKNG